MSLPEHASRLEPTDLTFLIQYICDNLVKGRKDMFVQNNNMYVESIQMESADNSSRPGVLVLVNDADWELEGEGAYQLKSGDNIAFVSTLHGG